MSIQIVCTSCHVRLTLADDRAGDLLDCPRCDTPIRVPSPAPNAPPPEANPVAITPAQPKPTSPPTRPIKFLCPHCRVTMTIEREKSGSAITCPKCRQQVTVPEEDEKPPLGLPVSPAPSANPAPPSSPASNFDFDPEEDEEGDYETYRRRKRRRASGGFIWRAITLAPLGVAMLCFFLPWVRYSIVIPFPRQLVGAREPIEAGFGNQSGLQVRRDRIEFEFASQSGL